MQQQFRWVMAIALCLSGAAVPLALAQPSSKLLEMSDQLDKAEKQDFSAALEQADDCTRARSFDCSERELAKAERLANGAKNKQALQTARSRLAGERQLLAQEIRRAEERRLAELERERRAEERRLAELERERRAEEAAERRADEAASRAALVAALSGLGRQPPAQDWLMAETQRTLAQTPQLIAQAQREKEREFAARQAAANQAAQERLAARQEAQATADQRANAAAAQARRDEQARREREQQRRLDEERAAAAEAQRAARAREKAELEAAKRAEAAAERKARSDYLSQLIAGTRMVARKCPDGEGKYYIMGTFPRVSPQPVACKDVYYKATCPGDLVGVEGVATNFVGAATDCYAGDAVKIEPLSCKVEQVSVRVRDIRACGE